MREFSWNDFKRGLIHGFVVGVIIGFLWLVIDVKPLARKTREVLLPQKSNVITVVPRIPFQCFMITNILEYKPDDKYYDEMGGFYMEEK